MRRRDFLALAAAAVWKDDRLGVACNLAAEEGKARSLLDAAAQAGFRRIQLFPPWAKASGEYRKALPGWVRAAGLKAPVVGYYGNCCDPANPIMGSRESDLPAAIELAGQVKAGTLVAWTGGYGRDLMTADPRNFTTEAETAVVRFVEKHHREFEGAGLKLALEQYHTLVGPDAASLRRILDRLPGWVGAVLDPPNLTPVARFGERNQVLSDMFRILSGRVSVVHLKDFTLAPGANRYQLPGPLEGAMDYPRFVAGIQKLPPSTPVFAEHIGAAEFAATRSKLLNLFKVPA